MTGWAARSCRFVAIGRIIGQDPAQYGTYVPIDVAISEMFMTPGEDRHVRASASSEEIGRAVVSARAEFGLDQQTTADLAGVSVRFLRSVEKGKRSVQYDHLVAVLDVLGLALTLEGAGRD